MIKRFLVQYRKNSFDILSLNLSVINNKIVGVSDYSFNIITSLSQDIIGVEKKNGCWQGSNGSLQRYTNNCIVILLKGKDINCDKTNFYCCFSKEQRLCWLSTSQIVSLIKNNQYFLANGKVVKSDSGVLYISALAGNYVEIEVKNDEKDRTRIKTGNVGARVSETLRGNGKRESNEEDSFIVCRKCGTQFNKNGAEVESCRDRVSRALSGLNIDINENTPSEKFLDITLNAKKSNKHGCCVDVHSVEDYDSYKNRISFGSDACIAVKDDGDIVNVAKSAGSSIKGFVKLGYALAIENGGTKCDCYNINGGLPNIYCECGFIPVCRVSFMDEFAPDDWDFEVLGRPEIVFMAYCGDSANDMLNNHKVGYKGLADYDYNSLPLFSGEDGYDKACEYRDNCMKKGSLPCAYSDSYVSGKKNSENTTSDDIFANTLLNVSNKVSGIFSGLKS